MEETQVGSLVREDQHALEQLGLCATTTEPVSGACVPHLLKPACLDPVLHKREAHTLQPSVALLTATRERLCTATKTQSSQK